jgi:hypothetical protein
MEDSLLLSNINIIAYCKLFKINLHHCMSKDLYDDIIPKVGCYVINLEDSDAGNGTHWTCLIITKRHAIYFDSFGLPIPESIKNFIHRFSDIPIIYSTDQIQHMDSLFCGWFVIYFMWYITVKNKYSVNSYRNLNKHNVLYNLLDRKSNDKIIQRNIKYILSTI